MSKARKRRNNVEDVEQYKPSKKYKKTPEKQSHSLGIEGSSEVDSGHPTPDSSLNENRTPETKVKSSVKTSAAKKTSKSLRKYEADDIKSLNVSQLLDLGEGKRCETEETFITSDCGGSSDEDDWEEVKMEEKLQPKDPVIPKEGVNITLEVPGLNSFKRKKKGFDLEAHIKRQMNQVKRELQLLIHKVHVLCWIAHLKFVNKVLNSETLMGICLSLINNKNLYPPKYSDLGYLERIVKWFHSIIELKEFLKNPVKTKELSEQLCHSFSVKAAYCKKHFIFMFIVLCRTLGLKTRLVMSFQVVSIRPKNIDLSTKINSEKHMEAGSSKAEHKSLSKSVEGKVKILKVENSSYFSEASGSVSTNKRENKKLAGRQTNSDVKVKKVTPKVAKPSSTEKETNKVHRKQKSVPEDSDSDESMTSKHFKSVNVRSKTIRTKKEKKSECQDSALANSGGDVQISSGIKESSEQTPKVKGKLAKFRSSASKNKIEEKEGNHKSVKRTKGVKAKAKSTTEVKNKIIEKATQSSDTDSDFVPQSLKKKPDQSDIDRRVFSSDEDQESTKRQGVDVWAEIFLEAEEKWICVDAVRQRIHCVNELYSRATQPVVYIVACNNDSTLKDITKRYVPNWHSDTRKRRVDEGWWNETMWPYQGSNTAQDREEDEDIQRQMLDKPLPAVITEYKDHPLYALKRHLLKFEAIYPPEAPTLGFVKGEPVYARECVVTLRSREVWFKEARVVRLKEQPYKIVKARPKYDKMSGEFKKDLPLELFGFWQTDEYIPPIAVDGKVPRNEFGNVDLFKPSMLPKGTVHLQIPALNKVAKKLGIDCAAAVTGFEFHSGASHPILDGFVVCEEVKDVLLDAWNKEIDESNKRNEEKRLKRIYDNWKRLIRGLLIRERLKLKYAFGDDDNRKSSKIGAINKKSKSKGK